MWLLSQRPAKCLEKWLPKSNMSVYYTSGYNHIKQTQWPLCRGRFILQILSVLILFPFRLSPVLIFSGSFLLPKKNNYYCFWKKKRIGIIGKNSNQELGWDLVPISMLTFFFIFHNRFKRKGMDNKNSTDMTCNEKPLTERKEIESHFVFLW